jgi:hypothetical protein
LDAENFKKYKDIQGGPYVQRSHGTLEANGNYGADIEVLKE